MGAGCTCWSASAPRGSSSTEVASPATSAASRSGWEVTPSTRTQVRKKFEEKTDFLLLLCLEETNQRSSIRLVQLLTVQIQIYSFVSV